jgi:plastocyanin
MSSPRVRVFALVAALSVGALLAACGGGDDGGGGGGGGGALPPHPNAPELTVTGDSLSFDPDELEVPAGRFNVALTSGDQFHDFVIEDVDGIVEASSGETETAGFRIDEPGDYTFYCSVPGHRQGGMEGTLTVT